MSGTTNKEDSNTNSQKAGEGENNVQKQLDAFSSSFTKKLDQLFQKLDSAPSRQAPAPVVKVDEPDLETLMITDPRAAAALIKKQAKDEIMGEVGKQTRAQNEFNTAFSAMSQDYPEILSDKSDLYVRAKELLGQYSKGENDAEALERAIFKAANELGVVPLKRRSKSSEDDDSFQGASGNSEGSSKNRRKQAKEGELSAETLAFAQLLGKDVSDTKYLEKLKDINKKRTGTWNRYK